MMIMITPGNEMKILGIDPGQTTGWAVIEIGKDRIIKPIDFGTIPVLSNHPHAPLECVYDWLRDEYHVNERFQVLVYEEAPTKGRFVSYWQHQLLGVVKLFIYQEPELKSYRYHAVTVKATLGCGRMTKAQMQTRISAFLGIQRIKSPDAADAMALACTCALRIYGAQWPQGIGQIEAPRARGGRKKADSLTPEQMAEAIRTGRAVWQGKRIVGIK